MSSSHTPSRAAQVPTASHATPASTSSPTPAGASPTPAAAPPISAAAATAIGEAPAVEITAVSVEAPAGLLRANLERPVVGEPLEGFCIPLVGWALAPDGEPLDIQLDDSRRVLLRLARRVRRPDVAAAFPDLPGADMSGFSLMLSAARLPREFELRLSARGGDLLAPLARIQGTRRRFEPASDLALAPLMVTTLGRTGSTLLLTLLSLHPSIAAFRPTAYDSRPLAHWLDAATALATPSSRMQLLHSAGEGRDWWLGREPVAAEELQRLEQPIRDLLVGPRLEETLRLALGRATEFARRLALADGDAQVSYSAEKCSPGYLPGLLHELSESTREIFLVRDFRDVFASMLAFNAKRGYSAFGREHVSTDEQFLERLAADVEVLAANWAQRRERALLVRYEDLIADPEATLARILVHLGLDAERPSVESLVADAYTLLETTRREHRTTLEASASSGRWQRDLTPALRRACTEAFARPLREFGYP